MSNILLEKSILDYLENNQVAIKSYIKYELTRCAKTMSDNEDFEDLYTVVYIKLWNTFKIESMIGISMISYCQMTIKNAVQDLIRKRTANKRDARKTIPWDPELDFAIPEEPEDDVKILFKNNFGMTVEELLIKIERIDSPLTYVEYTAIKKFIENDGSLYKNGGENKKYNRPFNRAIAKLKEMYNVS